MVICNALNAAPGVKKFAPGMVVWDIRMDVLDPAVPLFVADAWTVVKDGRNMVYLRRHEGRDRSSRKRSTNLYESREAAWAANGDAVQALLATLVGKFERLSGTMDRLEAELN